MHLFGFGKKKDAVPGISAIGIHDDGVSLVRVTRPADARPCVAACEYVNLAAGTSPVPVLKELAQRHNLAKAHCTTSLCFEDYRLLMVEAPDVPADELPSAMRWRVKDLLDFDVNDATIQIFDFPAGASVGGREKAVYLVAAENDVIGNYLTEMDQAGINLEVIDIPEMAQRNLAALLPSDETGTALLSLSDNGGLITLTKQGQLYISRTLDTGLRVLRERPDDIYYLDRIAMEVQRSLDYYTSHFKQAPIDRLYLAPAPVPLDALLNFINGTIPTEPIRLSELLDWEEQVPETVEAKCLFTVGAALRTTEQAA